MAGLFYYRHLIGDYDTATKDLTLLEHGAYRRLLDGYYANKGPIDADKLYRIAGAFAPDEQAAVRKVAGMFFEFREGFVHNAKCEEEIARVLNESERQRAIARSRWSKDQDATASPTADATAHATASPTADAVALPFNSHKSEKHNPLNPPQPPQPPQPERELTPSEKAKLKHKNYRFELPDYIPEDAWDAFIDMRKKTHRPLTQWGMHLTEIELGKLHKAGNDMRMVLDQSTLNSWTGVFPVRARGGAGRRGHTESRNDDTAAAWAENHSEDDDNA